MSMKMKILMTKKKDESDAEYWTAATRSLAKKLIGGMPSEFDEHNEVALNAAIDWIKELRSTDEYGIDTDGNIKRRR